MGGQRHDLAAYPGETDPVLIIQEPGWPAGQVWTDRDPPPTPASIPCAVRPVVSRYTDYAIPDHVHSYMILKVNFNIPSTSRSPNSLILPNVHVPFGFLFSYVF